MPKEITSARCVVVRLITIYQRKNKIVRVFANSIVKYIYKIYIEIHFNYKMKYIYSKRDNISKIALNSVVRVITTYQRKNKIVQVFR